jgi:hypothetical protein
MIEMSEVLLVIVTCIQGTADYSERPLDLRFTFKPSDYLYKSLGTCIQSHLLIYIYTGAAPSLDPHIREHEGHCFTL